MKKTKKACLSILLALVLISSFTVTAGGIGDTDIEAILTDTAAFLLDTVSNPGIGQTGGEWTVIALMRSGAAIPDRYIRAYYNRVADQIDLVRGLLSTVKYSEYSRVALAMAAVGADPRDVGGYDMIEPLSDFDMTINQGINGPIFALLALGGAGFGHEPVTERYIEFILERQLEDGGFTLSGTISDPDTTAMALTALSRYRSRADVAEAIDGALERLSHIQRPTGGFISFSSTNSESVSQAIIALCSLEIPLDDERFVKDGNTLLHNLLTYYADGRGFEHERGGGMSLMATEQALCALAALWRHQTGQNALYDMGDAPVSLPDDLSDDSSGKHQDVDVPGVINPGITFDDIGGHEYEPAIRALAERGIITGYTAGRFAPDREITRAEIAAMFVRALGLGMDHDGIEFSDVSAGSWFFDHARTACEYGIIESRSTGIFDSGGLIDRQEASIMVLRAAALCGLAQELDDTAIRNILAQFVDYRSAAAWAAEALAFCYYFGIMDDSVIEIMPFEPILRGEAADIVFRILDRARLISF